MTTQFTRLAAAALLLVAAVAAPAYPQDAKAMEVIAKTRKALGDRKLEALKTLSIQAGMDRNIGTVQTSSEVEMFLEMPDKYLKSEVSRGMMNMTMNTGFNGDTAIMPGGGNMSMAGGGAMVFRMGPAARCTARARSPRRSSSRR